MIGGTHMEERHEIIHFKNDIPVKIFLHRLGDAARHWHQSLELLMIVYGKVVLLQDDRTFELEKDDLVLIGSNSIHELHSDDCVLVAVQLKLSKFDATEVAKHENLSVPYLSSFFERNIHCVSDINQEAREWLPMCKSWLDQRFAPLLAAKGKWV
jgi:mannose-6-phosphate isomerase-like protein (cupin superfamily)